MKSQKILTLENVDRYEQRFLTYLSEYHSTAEVVGLFSITSEYGDKDKVLTALKDPELTDLMMESTFDNVNQLLQLAGFLVKFKEEISFRNITVMYTYNQFDNFLNKLIRTDKAAKEILRGLFEVYTVKNVKYEAFEKDIPGQIFKQEYFVPQVFYFQEVELKLLPSVGDDYFLEYVHSPYIDTREGWRPQALVPLNREVITGRTMEHFFNEVQAMLEHQKEIIEEDTRNPDHEENLKLNENNLGLLNYLRLSFSYESLKQERFLNKKS